MIEPAVIRRGPMSYLRRVRPDDAEVFYSWYCNREIQRNLADPWWNPGIDFETYRRYRFALNLEPSPTNSVMVICSTNDQPIGLVNYFDFDVASQSCEVGIIIGETGLWRRGYALEALRLLLDFLVVNMEVRSVRAQILEENAASKSLFAKAGFVRRGSRKEQDYTFMEYIYSAGSPGTGSI
jgi:diamine N-acetyltransferase